MIPHSVSAVWWKLEHISPCQLAPWCYLKLQAEDCISIFNKSREMRPALGFKLAYMWRKGRFNIIFALSRVRTSVYPLCQLNKPNIVFALGSGKPFYKEEQQKCCSSLWHLRVWFHSHFGWSLPGELINIHSHLIFMERINTVFVWNPIRSTEHRIQQCKIRATQCEQYMLLIENQFILASVWLQFMINLKKSYVVSMW